MPMKPSEWFSDEVGVRLAGAVSRMLPRPLGYAAADFIADCIRFNRNARIVRAVRANQWVARGENLAGRELDRAVGETFRHMARAVFDLNRGIRNPRETRASIVLDGAARELFERPEFDERGLVVASLHLGEFDLILHLMSMQGMKPLVLTIPDPRGGRRAEFESRRRAGANLLPASYGAFRTAVRHLRRGGLVATGIDRPIPGPKIRPRFFGRPASLPLHPIRLALQAGVPVIVAATIRRPDGIHEIFCSGRMEMEPHPDRDTEILRNAETVLRAAEDCIRRAPSQWAATLAVWPEAVDEAPG